MLFPDVAPSRASLFQAVASALEHEQGGIFVDASVLLHCYEISVGAAKELLAELAAFATRLHIPVWVAQETWKGGAASRAPTPLKPSSSNLANKIDAFVQEAMRVADDTVGTGTLATPRAEFIEKLKTASKTLKQLVSLVGDHRLVPADTAAGLNDLLKTHVLTSPMADIYAKVIAEGEFRHEHSIPPGFADARKQKNGDAANPGVGNRYGDLIAWFEILHFAQAEHLQHIVLITRDVEKGDWVHKPPKFLDDKARPQPNHSITLPLPLLVQEAKKSCSDLQQLHIISLDQFVQVLSSNLNRRLPKLTAALQDSVEPLSTPVLTSPAPQATVAEPVSFVSSDLTYAPDAAKELDAIALQLWTSDWHLQADALKSLDVDDLSSADRLQKIFFGRSLAYAANNQSVVAENVLSRLLTSDSGTPDPHLFLGVLAEIYLDEDARLKKPVASPGLCQLVYDSARSAALTQTTKLILDRTNPLRAQYLGLPDEEPATLRLEVGGRTIKDVGTQLASVQVGAVQLLESDAATSRQIDRSGGTKTLTGSELLELIATEFVVPSAQFEAAFPSQSLYVIPKRMGFVAWGPGMGLDLRSNQ